LPALQTPSQLETGEKTCSFVWAAAAELFASFREMLFQNCNVSVEFTHHSHAASVCAPVLLAKVRTIRGILVPSRGQNWGQNPFVALPRMAESLQFFDGTREPTDGFELPVPREMTTIFEPSCFWFL
jgi:hypothetical protein